MNETLNALSFVASVANAGGFNFNIAFYVCLILGLLLFVLDVVLFFVLDIPNVYLIWSGKGAKQTIKRMEQINAETGRLRRPEESSQSEPKARKEKSTGISKKLKKDTVKVRTQVAIEAPPAAAEQETAVLTNQQQPQSVTYKRITSGRFEIVHSTIYIHSKDIV